MTPRHALAGGAVLAYLVALGLLMPEVAADAAIVGATLATCVGLVLTFGERVAP